MNYRFNASRGGHAPGHLRQAFVECVERGDLDWWQVLADNEVLIFCDQLKQRWCETLSTAERARWLIGQLWNCTDVLPGAICSALYETFGLEVGTYAQAKRALKKFLDEEEMGSAQGRALAHAEDAP